MTTRTLKAFLYIRCNWWLRNGGSDEDTRIWCVDVERSFMRMKPGPRRLMILLALGYDVRAISRIMQTPVPAVFDRLHHRKAGGRPRKRPQI